MGVIEAARILSAEQVRADLRAAIEGLDIVPAEDRLPQERTVHELRRSRLQGADDTVGMLTLVRVDGILQWEEGTGVSSRIGGVGPGRRWRRRVEAASGEVMDQLKFPKLAPNQVGSFLETLDRKFCAYFEQRPAFGLREWTGGDNPQTGVLKSNARPVQKEGQRILVFIHGIFSNNDHLLSELTATDHGRKFLAQASKHYDQILAFDHPTLTVGPLLNALDLARAFAGSQAQVDIIAHSRGGLVTRWWLEGFNGTGRPSRAVLVGSPLYGTSLASPGRLRGAMSLLTNYGEMIGGAAKAASMAVPMMAAAVGVLKVVTSVTSLAADTPLFDAAIAMVPGLAACSRVSNNGELNRLREIRQKAPAEYFAVTANFEPENPGWKFWKGAVDRFKDAGADIVFRGDELDGADNDLVVNTKSMTTLYGLDDDSGLPEHVIPESNTYSFGTNAKVFHTNYFRQPETIAFLTKHLFTK
jgi:pimeloyl-ACP methyl ester carboxylesterase